MTIRALVWNENVHERKNRVVAENYPLGIQGPGAALLSADGSIAASAATPHEHAPDTSSEVHLTGGST